MRVPSYSGQVGEIVRYRAYHKASRIVIASEGLLLRRCSRCSKNPIVQNTTGDARNSSESWFSAP